MQGTWSYTCMRKLINGKVLGYGRCCVVFSCAVVAYCGFVLVLQTVVLIRDLSNFNAESEEHKARSMMVRLTLGLTLQGQMPTVFK